MSLIMPFLEVGEKGDRLESESLIPNNVPYRCNHSDLISPHVTSRRHRVS